jgi:hypothetical protein
MDWRDFLIHLSWLSNGRFAINYYCLVVGVMVVPENAQRRLPSTITLEALEAAIIAIQMKSQLRK